MHPGLYSQLFDPSWRVNHLYRVVNKQGQRVRFRENAAQRRIREHRATHRGQLILKARQLGISTGCLIDMADNTFFTRNVTNMIMAHETSAIRKLFRIVTRAYDALDDDLKPRLDRGGGSQYEMYFPEINSRIYCGLKSRGDTIQRLHISEAAFIKDTDNIAATLQTVPLTGRISVETTANGLGNHFYDTWSTPPQGYGKIFYPWFIHHEYTVEVPKGSLSLTDEERALIATAQKDWSVEISEAQIAFRRFKVSELKSLDVFLQEYPEDDQSCFLSSGAAAMNLRVIKELLDALSPPHETDLQGALEVYEPYIKGEVYAVGADTAEGLAKGDYSAAKVFKVRTLEEVASLHGHFKPIEFASKLVSLCERYSAGGRAKPILAVERNNHGHAVLLALDVVHQYPYLYFGDDERAGWLTNLVSRPIMLDAFIDGVENRQVTIRHAQTLQECLTLIDDGGKIQAAPGKHDDNVIASAITLQMCLRERPKIDLYENLRERILMD